MAVTATPRTDWSKRSTVKGMAGWIGKQSDAIVVMVVRAEDTVFWMHDGCKPEDGADLVQGLLGEMVAETKAEREAARVEKALKESRKGTGR